MNKEKVTATFAAKFIRESSTRQRLWDIELGGFYLLSLGNGKGSWRVKYRALDGRSREITIGQYPAMTPEQARKEAKIAINQADTGNDPLQAREDKKQEALKLKEQTMRAYLAGAYSVYQASRKSGQQTQSILHNHFADWLDRPMTELKPADVLAWQGKKMAEGLHFATMTRTYGALNGLFVFQMASLWSIEYWKCRTQLMAVTGLCISAEVGITDRDKEKEYALLDFHEELMAAVEVALIEICDEFRIDINAVKQIAGITRVNKKENIPNAEYLQEVKGCLREVLIE